MPSSLVPNLGVLSLKENIKDYRIENIVSITVIFACPLCYHYYHYACFSSHISHRISSTIPSRSRILCLYFMELNCMVI